MYVKAHRAMIENIDCICHVSMIFKAKKCKITNWGGGGGKCKKSVRREGEVVGWGSKSQKRCKIIFEQPLGVSNTGSRTAH